MPVERDGRGRLFVVSGPSGVGKGTGVRRLLALMPELTYSVSCTTRDRRPGEVEGKDYRLVADATFARLVDAGAWLEWPEVLGHRYGTLHAPIEEAMGRARNVVL